MNVFSAVIGVLVAIALVLIGISRLVDGGPKGARDTQDPLMQASAHERIKPFGQVAVAGKDNSALAIQETAVPVVAGASGTGAAAAPTDGKSAFDAACSACHSSSEVPKCITPKRNGRPAPVATEGSCCRILPTRLKGPKGDGATA